MHNRDSWEKLAKIAAYFGVECKPLPTDDWDFLEAEIKKILRSSRAGRGGAHVVHNDADGLHVYAAREDVGRDEHFCAAVAEFVDDVVALGALEGAAQLRDFVAVLREAAFDFGGRVAAL